MLSDSFEYVICATNVYSLFFTVEYVHITFRQKIRLGVHLVFRLRSRTNHFQSKIAILTTEFTLKKRSPLHQQQNSKKQSTLIDFS
jgi:hypothetical protein